MKSCPICSEPITNDRWVTCQKIECHKLYAKQKYKMIKNKMHSDGHGDNWVCDCGHVIPITFGECLECKSYQSMTQLHASAVFDPEKHGLDVGVLVNEYYNKLDNEIRIQSKNN